MLRSARLAVIVCVITSLAALTACGSSGNGGTSGSTDPVGSSALQGSGSQGSGSPDGNTGSGSPDSSSGLASPPCNPVEPLAGWSGIYDACVSSNGTFTQLTNNSDWEVLLLQVPAGGSVPHLNVTLGQGGQLEELVEQTEFREPIGSAYALVPPHATLTSTSVDGTPVHLDISIDFTFTAQNVTAMGLVSLIQDKVNPVGSEASAIVNCAEYVHSLPEQINQSQPSSPSFWNNFVNTAQCYDAFRTASAAIGVGETAVIDDAAAETSGFFDEILPKLVGLVSETIFR